MDKNKRKQINHICERDIWFIVGTKSTCLILLWKDIHFNLKNLIWTCKERQVYKLKSELRTRSEDADDEVDNFNGLRTLVLFYWKIFFKY